MPLSKEQTNDINNAIRRPYAPLFGRNTTIPLELIVEKGYFDADFWLNDPVFMSKGEANTSPPNHAEIVKAINEAFGMTHHMKRYPEDRGVSNQFIYDINTKTARKNKDKDSSDDENSDNETSNSRKNNNIKIKKELITKIYTGKILRENLKNLLKNPEFNIDETYHPYGYTLLHYAVLGLSNATELNSVWASQTEIVQELLKVGGANPNLRDANQQTPLALAALSLEKESAFSSSTSSSSKSNKNSKKYALIKEMIWHLVCFGARLDLLNVNLPSILNDNFLTSSVILNEFSRQSETTIDLEMESLSKLVKNFFSIVESEILRIIRTSKKPEELLLTEWFAVPGERLLVALLNLVVKHRRFNLARQCIAYCKLEVYESLMTSLLTFTLKQAFEARYTFKEEYFAFARELLLQGVKAADEAVGILESFYPDLPEDLLTLTGVDTKFKEFIAKPCDAEVKKAKENLRDTTEFDFTVIKTKNGFALQYQYCLQPSEAPGLMPGIIEKNYPGFTKNKFIEYNITDIGGSWRKVTWTIPPENIARFSQTKLKVVDTPVLDAQEASETEKKNAVKRELNLLRTKAPTEKIYAELQKIMPNEWQLVSTQNGYDLQYFMGFNHQKKILDNKDPYNDICEWLRFNSLNLKVEKRTDNIGTIVITSESIQNFLAPSPNNQEKNTKTLSLSSLLRMVQLNPKDINSLHGEKKQTPLMYAVIEGDVDAVKMLIDHNPNLDIQDSDGRTVIDWVIQKLDQLENKPSAEKNRELQKIKQMLLLLGQVESSTWQHVQNWTRIDCFIPNCKNECDQFWMKKQKEKTDTKCGEDQSISPRYALYLSSFYNSSLLRLQEYIVYSPLKLSDSDEQYVPNLLNALDAISSDDVESFIPQASSSLGIPSLDMFILKKLPHDPHQCIMTLMQKKNSFYENCFQKMIAYYCQNDVSLRQDLMNFQKNVLNPPDEYEYRNRDMETSFIRKQIKNWGHRLRSKNSTLNTKLQDEDLNKNFRELKDELLRQTLFQNNGLTSASHPTTDESLAQLIVATNDLIQKLEKESIANTDLIQLTEEYRGKLFGFSDKVWILFSRFINALLSVLNKASENIPENASFVFFKPFEKEPLKEKSLELLESFEHLKEEDSVSVNTI